MMTYLSVHLVKFLLSPLEIALLPVKRGTELREWLTHNFLYAFFQNNSERSYIFLTRPRSQLSLKCDLN